MIITQYQKGALNCGCPVMVYDLWNMIQDGLLLASALSGLRHNPLSRFLSFFPQNKPEESNKTNASTGRKLS